MNIFACEQYKIKKFNALNTTEVDAQGNASTGINATVRDITTKVCAWKGYIFHNNDNAARWVTIYLKPAADVVLGTTVPDFTILIGANASVTWDFRNPIISEKGLSIAAATTETGTSGPTAAVTGAVLYAERG